MYIAYIALFRRHNMKQNRLEKQNFKQETANVQMFRAVGVIWNCPVCNQRTFSATRSTARIKLWIYVTDMVYRSRVQPSLFEEERYERAVEIEPSALLA